MELSTSRLASLAVAAVYLIAALVSSGSFVLTCIIAFYLLFPLALIWFDDVLGSFTGYVGRGGMVDNTSPPVLISGFGWLILIGVPVATYLWG